MINTLIPKQLAVCTILYWAPLWLPVAFRLICSFSLVFRVIAGYFLYDNVRRDVLLPAVRLVSTFDAAFLCLCSPNFTVLMRKEYRCCGHVEPGLGCMTSCRPIVRHTVELSYCHCAWPVGLRVWSGSGCVSLDFGPCRLSV